MIRQQTSASDRVDSGSDASRWRRMLRRSARTPETDGGGTETVVAVDRSDWTNRCDRACAASVPMLAAASGLMLLLSLMFGGHSFDTLAGIFAALVDSVTGVVLIIGGWNIARATSPVGNCHQTAIVVLGVTALSLSISMVAGASLDQTAYMELLVVVAGAVMLRSGWFAISLAGLWAMWLGVAALLAGTVSSSSWVLAMLGASVISIAIHLMRVQGVRALSTALSAAEAEAVEDVLTGLPNRRGLRVVGAEMLAISHRNREAIACTFIDVDGLKTVNDVRGHEAGDEVLVTVAEALTDVFRECDLIARWGGDEFAVLALGSGPSADDVERRLTHRLEAMDSRLFGSGLGGVSAGRIVHMPWQDEDLDDILDRADQEMYRRRNLRRAKGRDLETQ